MKILSTWEDVFYQTKNTLYELPNGVRLFHVEKPSSLEFELGVVIKGGAYYEEQLKLPRGTAHLLEHMICNPNKVLKSDEEMQAYKFGNADRAKFHSNAYTGYYMMGFETYGNMHSFERAVNYTFYQLDYPFEKFDEHLEKEKSIVLTEMQGYLKDELDPNVQYTKFILKDNYKGLQKRLIGDEKELKKIKPEHLIKMWKAMFTTENVVIAVQTPGEIPASILKIFENISQLCNTPNNLITLKEEKLDNKIEFGYFQDKQVESGLHIDFSFFEPNYIGERLTPAEILKMRLRNFVASAIRYKAFMELRQKKGLIYSLDTFNDGIGFGWNNIGMVVKCERKNLVPLLESLHDILNIDIPKFLGSDESNTWLADMVSSYVYPNNVAYNHDYAKTKALNIIYNSGYINNTQLSVDVSKKITTKDLFEYYNNSYPKIQWRVWVTSPFEENEIKGEVLGSKFFK